MSERDRFSMIEATSTRKRSFEERLNDQPELKSKVARLLDVIENAAGDVEKAAEAERRVIEELRQMGNEVLHGWARRQQQKKEEEFDSKPGVNRKEKKRLLVHPVRENRNRGADLYPRTSRSGDPAVF
jgi:ATP/maltotriose-dependent transcriptional regulator MalT